MDIEIEKTDGFLKIYAPYNPIFVSEIKKISNAKWTGSAWKITEKAEEQVLELLKSAYGYKDKFYQCIVDLYLLKKYKDYGNFLFIDDFMLCQRKYRNSHVEFCENAVVISGRIPSSGGNRANPRIGDLEENTLLKVDLPKTAIDKFMEDLEKSLLNKWKVITEDEAQKILIVGKEVIQEDTLEQLENEEKELLKQLDIIREKIKTIKEKNI